MFIIKMKKQIVGIVLGIVFLSLVGAMYSGETEIFDMGYEIVNCSIENNTYDLEGLNLSWEKQNAILVIDTNYRPDNFTIDCFVTMYGETKKKSSGGSSSCTYKTNYDWNCSEWSGCNNERQTRTCKDYNNCGNSYGKPAEEQFCTSSFVDDEVVDEPEQESSNLYQYIVSVIVVLLIIGIVWIIKARRKVA